MTYHKKFKDESRADILRRHRYGELVGVLLNRSGLPVHSVTQKPVRQGSGLQATYTHEYYVHTRRRKIAQCTSLEDLQRWASLLGLRFI